MMLILPIYGIQNDLLGKQQRQLAQVCTVCALSPTRWTIFRLGMTLAPLTLTLSHKGRGDQSAGHRGLRGVEGKATNKNRSPRAAVFLLAQPVGSRRQQGQPSLGTAPAGLAGAVFQHDAHLGETVAGGIRRRSAAAQFLSARA